MIGNTPPNPLSDGLDRESVEAALRRVLVVDDAADNRNLLYHLLHSIEMEVTTAEDGKTALDKLKTEHIDLILMDMNMPVMDGFETVQIIRENGFQGAIIALTGSTGTDLRERCLQAGCNEYVGKPFEYDHLVEILKKHLAPPAQAKQVLQNFRKTSSFTSLVNVFLEHLPERFHTITSALEQGYWSQLEISAHQLLNAEMFGFPILTHIAREIESGAQEACSEKCRQAISQLQSEAEEILQEHNRTSSYQANI